MLKLHYNLINFFILYFMFNDLKNLMEFLDSLFQLKPSQTLKEKNELKHFFIRKEKSYKKELEIQSNQDTITQTYHY